jgi:nucleoside-diphosphate-sugar epimerase
MLSNEKILITGPASQVAEPIAAALAKNNEVWGIARFSDPVARGRLEAAGVRCVAVDLVAGDFSALPDDFTLAMNFAVMKSNVFDRDIAGNVEGTGLLMHHCRNVRAFLHCSSTAVYEPNDHEPLAETDMLGDNHKPFGFLPTYSICKIAAEGMARYAARQWNLPTTIARLNVPYGGNGGWPAFHLALMKMGRPIPVHENAPSQYCPIHEDDILTHLPALIDAASVPATIVNWGGDEVVSIEEWCAYLGELTGLEPSFEPTQNTIESAVIDTTKMHELIGGTSVGWRDGMRRMVATLHPDMLGQDTTPGSGH